MPEQTAALLIFLLPLAYSPGPGNLFFAANGARFGILATLPASAGYHAATWIVTVAIGLGFAAFASNAPGLLALVKYAGAAYVLAIAARFLRAGALDGETDARAAGPLDGAALLVLNPKAYVIIALMFTQFLGEQTGASPHAVLWISTVFTLNNLVAFSLWTAAGDRLAAAFRSETAARRLNIVFGLALALVALWMLLKP